MTSHVTTGLSGAPTPLLVDLKTAAAMLGCCVQTVEKLARMGLIPLVRFPGWRSTRRVYTSDLHTFILGRRKRETAT